MSIIDIFEIADLSTNNCDNSSSIYRKIPSFSYNDEQDLFNNNPFSQSKKSESQNYSFFSENELEPKIKKENNNFIGKKLKFRTDKLKDTKILFNTGKFDDYSEEIFNEAFESFKALASKNRKIKNILGETKIRKNMNDEIRTKFMSKFFKCLIKRLNIKLKLVKSKKLFHFLPAIFIKNYTSNILKAKKTKNFSEIDLTFKGILSTNFYGTENISKLKKNKYSLNLSTLEYLEDNTDINEYLNYNMIKNKKFSQLFQEYLYSKEFKMDIYYLKFKKKKDKNKEENKENIEDDEYIIKYIINAFDFINSFHSGK